MSPLLKDHLLLSPFRSMRIDAQKNNWIWLIIILKETQYSTNLCCTHDCTFYIPRLSKYIVIVQLYAATDFGSRRNEVVTHCIWGEWHCGVVHHYLVIPRYLYVSMNSLMASRGLSLDTHLLQKPVYFECRECESQVMDGSDCDCVTSNYNIILPTDFNSCLLVS